jgi:hypothetical protein
VAVVAALGLSGCSGSAQHAAQEPTASRTVTLPPAPTTAPAPTGSSTPTATGSESPGTTDSGGASTDSTQSVEGVWLATEDGTKVQLVLGKGKAGLTSTHLCGGSYTDHNGMSLDVTLTCMDGDRERTSGHGVMAADGKTLTVQWTDGPTDAFTRTGLPSS